MTQPHLHPNSNPHTRKTNLNLQSPPPLAKPTALHLLQPLPLQPLSLSQYLHHPDITSLIKLPLSPHQRFSAQLSHDLAASSLSPSNNVFFSVSTSTTIVTHLHQQWQHSLSSTTKTTSSNGGIEPIKKEKILVERERGEFGEKERKIKTDCLWIFLFLGFAGGVAPQR
jgi:hypothetical protein